MWQINRTVGATMSRLATEKQSTAVGTRNIHDSNMMLKNNWASHTIQERKSRRRKSSRRKSSRQRSYRRRSIKKSCPTRRQLQRRPRLSHARREKREERREKRTDLIYNAEKDSVALHLQFCAIATVKRSNAWQQKRTQASCKANPTQCCRRCTVTHRRTQMSIYMRVLV